MNAEKNQSSIGDDLAVMLGTAKAEEASDEPTSKEELVEEDLGEDEAEEVGGEDEEAEEAGADEDGEGGEEAEEAEGEEEEASDTEVAVLKEQLRELQERLASLEKAEEPEEEVEEEPPALESNVFIKSDDELDDIIENKDKLNAVLQKVAEHSYNKAIEAVLKVIPNTVVKAASAEVANQIAAMEFYRANDDLVPHKASVQKIYMEMLGKSPDKNPFEVLKTLAPEVRKRLKLKQKGQQQQQSQGNRFKKKKASFAPGSGAGRERNQPAEPKGIGSEINQMLNLR